MEHNQQGQPAVQANQHFVTAGPNSQQALDAEWEKYDRAHALLEAARRGLTDDRLALKEREEKLNLREAEVSRRESWIRARELELAAATAAAVKPPAPADSNPSFVTSPLRATRKLFQPKKGKA
jgi:hypothetical protein